MSDDSMLREHQATYHGFVRLVACAAAAAAITLILLAIVLL